MPIDIDQLRSLIKLAASVGPDKGSQAMAAAAQAAKPAGGIPLPKEVEAEDSPAEGVLSEEKAQMEQEKLEQQRRKELDAKENEIRGLQHELNLERVEREKMHNQHELDMRMRQEEAKLKADRDKLEKDRFQLVQEKARQDNLFKAEEMRHQATLDKATFKQEAELAKQQAQATADLAKQQAQSLIATNDKARQASDKYYADAKAKLGQEHPAISPALQNQLDGAISSLNRFKQVHKKQMAIPKPGTPPDLMKVATFGENNSPEQLARLKEQAANERSRRENESYQRELADAGVHNTSGAYKTQRVAAHYGNLAAKAKDDGNQHLYNRYTRMQDEAADQANQNYNHATKQDKALYDSYLDTRSRWNGFNTTKDLITQESQYDRDANAYNHYKAEAEYAKKPWYSKILPVAGDVAGSIIGDPYNAISDAAASHRNAKRFGANRFWNTTFDDESMKGAYEDSVRDMNYSDSVSWDVLSALGNTGLSLVTLKTLGAAAPVVFGAKKILPWTLKRALKAAGGAGLTGFDFVSSLFGNSDALLPGGEFMYKGASVLPEPGTPPTMIKKAANELMASTLNNYYPAHNLNNTAYYDPQYGSMYKLFGSAVNALTGGLINPYATVGKWDAYLRPKAPIPGTRIMQNVVSEADQETGPSNIHRVVANAAMKKHMPGVPVNYNGTIAQSQSVSGRAAANQLASALA